MKIVRVIPKTLRNEFHLKVAWHVRGDAYMNMSPSMAPLRQYNRIIQEEFLNEDR